MRFTAITIENYKNVEHGTLSFENPRVSDGPSILALYGQNGSGKSALVDCLLIFKKVITDLEGIPREFARYVSSKSENCRIVYELEFEDADGQPATAVYELRFSAKQPGEDPQSILGDYGVAGINNDVASMIVDDYPIRITYESLKLRRANDSRLRLLFASSLTQPISPKPVYNSSVKYRGSDQILRMACAEKHERGLSSLFVTAFDTPISKNPHPTDLALFNVKYRMKHFAQYRLFVVGTKESESIESGELAFFYDKRSVDHSDLNSEMGFAGDIRDYVGDEGVIFVSTDSGKASILKKWQIRPVRQTLCSINELLSVLVPGLSLSLEMKGTPAESLHEAYILAHHCDNSLPLACESRGIQKLVSIAWLLVGVYNDPSFTAVVDELDSGVFEYLLGEILDIVAEEGKGQLIFTSHNLRPLEVLDKGFIAFSTANPKNRYIRLKNVKTTNNLRDFYYRSILLGGQEESVYDPSTEGDIRLAFIKAGRAYGSEQV